MENIILYDKNTKKNNFNNYGLGVLKRVKSCTITQELNGRYDLEMEVYLDDTKSKHLTKWNIVRAEGQLFRIIYSKIIDNENITSIKAMHIFYDLQFGFIEDSRADNSPMLVSLEKSIATQYKDIFTCSSNITYLNNLYHVEDNGVTCIFNTIERWGVGELLRDNFHFEVNHAIGQDTGVTFTYKKIEGIEIINDHENVATKIYPKGYDGITLPEKYIDIPNWNTEEYLDVPITKLVRFEKAENEVDLRIVATEYAETIGLSTSNITIKLHDINNITAFNELKDLYKANIGDIITIKHSKLDIRVKVKIISITKELVTGKTELELGQPLDDFLKSVDNSNVVIDDSAIMNQMTKFQQGMYYYSNSEEINAETGLLTSLGYVRIRLSESNNLMGYATLNCIASSEGLATFSILIDNMPSDFKPIQKLLAGNNVISFNFPLLMLQSGQTHTIDLKITTSCNVTTFAQQFQLVVYGQFLEGGMSSEVPHIEVIEQSICYKDVMYKDKLIYEGHLDVETIEIPPVKIDGGKIPLITISAINDSAIVELIEVT